MAEQGLPSGYRYLIVVALILSVIGICIGFLGLQASGQSQEELGKGLLTRIQALESSQKASKESVDALSKRVEALEQKAAGN